MLSKKVYKLNARIFSLTQPDDPMLGNYTITEPEPRLYGDNPDNPGSTGETQQREQRKERIDEMTVILEDIQFRAASVALVGQHTSNDINKLGEDGIGLLSDLNDKDTYETSGKEKRIQSTDTVLRPADDWIKKGNDAIVWINSSADTDVYSVALSGIQTLVAIQAFEETVQALIAPVS